MVVVAAAIEVTVTVAVDIAAAVAGGQCPPLLLLRLFLLRVLPPCASSCAILFPPVCRVPQNSANDADKQAGSQTDRQADRLQTGRARHEDVHVWVYGFVDIYGSTDMHARSKFVAVQRSTGRERGIPAAAVAVKDAQFSAASHYRVLEDASEG